MNFKRGDFLQNFKINENDSGQRLNKFIEKCYFNVPKSLIYKAIRTKNIKVNKKRTIASYILKEGDFVLVYGLDEFFKKREDFNYENLNNFKLNIVFEDENILILNKEKGIKTQPNSQVKDSLIDKVLSYLINKKEYFPSKENSFTPAFCTRLDFNTSGLVVAGKNAKTLRCLNKLIAEGKIKKTYYCNVEGIMQKRKETLVGYWSKDQNKNKVLITNFKRENSKKVITEYFVLKQNKSTAFLKVILHTGKSHQIRAHLSLIKHPIVGDFKYGSKTKKNLQLVCGELQFFSENTYLNYLNNKKISIKNEKI